MYMFAVDSCIHVLLSSSTSRSAISSLTGGSKLGSADTATTILISSSRRNKIEQICHTYGHSCYEHNNDTSLTSYYILTVLTVLRAFIIGCTLFNYGIIVIYPK